ncbi:hypothetical protein, partial [Streptomyces sp. NPDC046909]|uniref:hypothetical protein n=1 Tax=Streptomyces sp. NPDC046909 TaxID=3155617 RepID=UPI0033FFB131
LPSCLNTAQLTRTSTPFEPHRPHERIENRQSDMGKKKKPKNRSNRQARQDRQVRALRVRQDQKVDAVLQAWQKAFDQAYAAGHFTVVDPQGQPVQLTLNDLRQALNTELAEDGEPPVEGDDELLGLLVDELEHGGLTLRPDGMWDVRPVYLSQTGAV